jgi:hypothetical protein
MKRCVGGEFVAGLFRDLREREFVARIAVGRFVFWTSLRPLAEQYVAFSGADFRTAEAVCVTRADRALRDMPVWGFIDLNDSLTVLSFLQ